MRWTVILCKSVWIQLPAAVLSWCSNWTFHLRYSRFGIMGQMVPVVSCPPRQRRKAVLSAKLLQTAQWNRCKFHTSSDRLCSLKASSPSFYHHKEANPWQYFAWGFRNKLPLWRGWGGSQSSAFCKKGGWERKNEVSAKLFFLFTTFSCGWHSIKWEDTFYFVNINSFHVIGVNVNYNPLFFFFFQASLAVIFFLIAWSIL